MSSTYGHYNRTCSKCNAPITSHNRSGMCKPCVQKRNQENRERGVDKRWLVRGTPSTLAGGCMITNGV